MSNLTLVIDDEVLRRARIRAATESTSVNAQVRDFIRRYAYDDDLRRDQLDATKWLLDLSHTTQTGGGLSSRDWTRDDVHER